MNAATYNSITIVLGIATLATLGVAFYSLIFMLVGWKTGDRRRHFMRLAFAIALVASLAAIQYFVLFFIYLPTLHRQRASSRDN
ncbi:hypothetical protein QTN89_29520, partial [Roseiconus lacunae]|nr:hypothetical protein [Roseiconus lacunae]